MPQDTFKAYLVTKTDQNQFKTEVVEQSLDNLPPGDVLIQVHYSSLNYKDALSAKGHPGVTKLFPHVPGVDAAGTVIQSAAPQFKADDPVIVTGFDLGMNTWGGFAQYIRVPAHWVVPLPPGLTLRESMILGTAGFTAALCVETIESNGISPASGEILVTGATGGVGSIAVSILSQLGYSVTAATGKADRHDFLKSLGATAIVSREELVDTGSKPLLKGRWAGAVEPVGGNILATTLKSMQYGGCVAACGLVAGAELSTTVYPFILRGVRLIGIDSVQYPIEKRYSVWSKLGNGKPKKLNDLATKIGLLQLSESIDTILQGENVGRVLVEIEPDLK